jgi:GAF domain-containing protein/HAMP domain-containing protein
VVDGQNRVVSHTDPSIAATLQDYTTHPAVSALRAGQRGLVSVSDEQSQRWFSFVDQLPNNWGVVVQQQQAELLAPLRLFRQVSWIALAFAAALLSALAALTIRQALRPIDALTNTATAIAEGDLSRVAPVESDDEIGVLAQTFNDMTRQLRSLIGGLEERVTERTRELERRTVQLEAASKVAREAAAIRDVNAVLNTAVHLISDRFGYYHAGIFLIDEAGEFAVLQAASSEGGRRMLARRHKLKIGQVGIVGYVAGTGEPRIALDVGADAVFFDNPDLPNTRSEMALPLKIRNRVIGVLDVQSMEPAAFSEDDVGVLQTLADQLGLAIENASLLQEAERRIREINLLLGEQTREGWSRLTGERPHWAYAFDGTGVRAIESAPMDDDSAALTVPLRVRNEIIGQLKLQLDGRSPTADEAEIAEAVISEAATALENARLFQETQRALQEVEALNAISSAVSRSLQLEETLKESLQQALEISGFDAGLISLTDGRSGELKLSVHHQLPQAMAGELAQHGMTGTLCELVYQRGAPVALEDLADAPTDSREVINTAFRSYLGVPLESRGEPLGALCAFGRNARPIPPSLISLLQAAGRQIGVAVENARLFQEARRRAERERMIADITGRIRSSASLERIVQTAARELGQALGASRVRIRVGLDQEVEATDRISEEGHDHGAHRR